MENDPQRKIILDLVREYATARGAATSFIPGESAVPPAGKVIDGDDLVHVCFTFQIVNITMFLNEEFSLVDSWGLKWGLNDFQPTNRNPQSNIEELPDAL